MSEKTEGSVDLISGGLFGYGHRGLPGEIDDFLSRKGAVEDLARKIITSWRIWAEANQVRGHRRVADSQLNEIGTLASILIRFHVRNSLVPTDYVAHAIDHALGVVNAHSKPLPHAKVLAMFDIPAVDEMESFLLASRLDGEADRKQRPKSVNALATECGVQRSTIRRWREMPQYVRRRSIARALGSYVLPDT